MSKILGCIKKADIDHKLIKNGDRILVGLSYGKDSMVMLEALRLYKMFSGKKYNIIAVNIDLGFPKQDNQTIKDFCLSNSIEFYTEVSEPLVYEVLKQHIQKDKLSCSICSRMRKAAICKAAHKYKCNKVAYAHHLDDAVETLFMNMIHSGKLATFKVKTKLSKERITLIRPLAYCNEKDIIHTVNSSNIPFLNSTCPNNKQTERENTKQLLSDIYKKYPESRNNFKVMLTDSSHRELWNSKRKR